MRVAKSDKARGRPPHPDILTPAEWRVVHAAQHGLINKHIAASLGVSLDAVKYHLANALGKLGLPNKKALRAWFRSPQGSALEKQLSEKQNTMDDNFSLNAIGQISRTVRNIKEAEDWYANVLGLMHLYTFDKLAFFDCTGTRLFLTEADGNPGSDSLIYFRVDNIEQSYEALIARGVQFSHAPHMIHKHENGTEEWMAFFSDPEGRPLGLMAQIAPAA